MGEKMLSLVPGDLTTAGCPSNAPPRFVSGIKSHAGYRSWPRSLPGAKSGIWQLSVLALSFDLWCLVGRPLPDLQESAMVSGLGLHLEQTGISGEGSGTILVPGEMGLKSQQRARAMLWGLKGARDGMDRPQQQSAPTLLS